MEKQITKSNETEWKPLIEEGIKTDGVYVKVLRYDESTKRSPTILLKFEPALHIQITIIPLEKKPLFLKVRLGLVLISLMPGIIYILRREKRILSFLALAVLYC